MGGTYAGIQEGPQTVGREAWSFNDKRLSGLGNRIRQELIDQATRIAGRSSHKPASQHRTRSFGMLLPNLTYC
jgi:hypothetical protein